MSTLEGVQAPCTWLNINGRASSTKKSINLSDQDPAQKKELIHEINLLRVLDHPYIVHLYECFNYNDEMHLIMENLEGGELYSMLRSGEKRHEFTDDEVASICHGALSALAYCHARKIVHRDLKPQNIVFPTKGDLSDVKIIDFGISKLGMKKTFWTSLPFRQRAALRSTLLLRSSPVHATMKRSISGPSFCFYMACGNIRSG